MPDTRVKYEVMDSEGRHFGWLEVANGCAEGRWLATSCGYEVDQLDLFPEAPYGIEECCAAIVKAMGSGSWSAVPWIAANVAVHPQMSSWTCTNAGPGGDHVDIGFEDHEAQTTNVMRFTVSEAVAFAEGVLQAARMMMAPGSNVTHEQAEGLADTRADTRPAGGM